MAGKRSTRKPVPRRDYYVYVIELSDQVGPRLPDRPSVYVGQSVQPPEVRFRQHREGYRSSRYVRKCGVRLRPRLYRSPNPLPTRGAAEAEARELGRRLKKRGYAVYGGH
jgi:hypothetical protein